MSKKSRLKKEIDGILDANAESLKKKDTSPVVHQKSKLKNELNIFHRELTQNQQAFLSMALDKNVKMIVISGPAGTAKTFSCVLAALELLSAKRVSDIIYVRSIVESSDAKMGFLPGESADKFAPYRQPLMDKVGELLSPTESKMLETENRLQGLPVGFLRGLNWNANVIIADEAQNMTKKELVTVMTRVGEFSKLFVIGDPEQSDIGCKSGFQEVYDLFNDDESRENGIYTFQFTDDDIVRSKLVQFISKKIKKPKLDYTYRHNG